MGEPVCRGSYALGTACGKCARCKEYQERYDARKQVDDALSGRSSLRARIAALEAELAAARRCPLCGGRTQEIAVKVKPLVWEGDGFWSNGPDEGWLEEAETSFGWGYCIEFGNTGPFKADSTFDWSQDGFEFPDDAKAAAQADWERRVISALECAPVKSAQARPSVAEASKVLADAMQDGEVWRVAVNAALASLHADMEASAWVTVCEVRRALDAALRAIAGEDGQHE